MGLCIGWLLNIFINRLQLSTFTLDDYDLRHFYDDFVALGGCLCMLVCRTNGNEFDVWMMKEYGVAESWTKFSVELNSCPYGFTSHPCV